MSAGLVGLLTLLAFCLWPARRGATPVAAQVAPVAPSGPVVGKGSGEGRLAVAEAMDLLSLALGSGAAVVSAVEEVAAHAGPVVAAHLRHVAAALRWGVDPAAAWEGLPEVWRPAAQAMSMATLAGVPPGPLLRRAAGDVREVERRRLEESASRLSVRIVIPLGLCFLPAFGLLTVVPIVGALASELMAGMP
ncbi:type II secretion system F family protein [Luteipulveratus flavus]|uniref:Type II secretion system F family protein n=1 Tax=Luteipulveratus flavus TaxID=3031728 RepID=A0ABT6C7B0_9MICO|nr:type II secretion system F family protein [Luteipulveratus sp. YIM 133296]MDF8264787.1 type II secretion system F family protein [Luteipulveratus sp. YIM 133296]